jgi:hypothetical protein
MPVSGFVCEIDKQDVEADGNKCNLSNQDSGNLKIDKEDHEAQKNHEILFHNGRAIKYPDRIFPTF